MRLAWSLLVLLTPEARGQSWGLWPLYTPLLGDISPDCRAASQEYVQSLTSALQATASGAPLTEEHLTALAMFDSNGALPFLQEGRLADVYPVDLCDTLVPEPGANQACRSQVPAGVRTVTIPFGHSLGPGVESQCREARANYCYNYFQPFPPLTSTPHTVQSRSTIPTSPTIPTIPTITTSPTWRITPNITNSFVHLAGIVENDQSSSTDLLDLMLRKSSSMRRLQSQVEQFLSLSDLAPTVPRQSAVLQVLGLVLFLWGSFNQNSGVGEWGKQAPLPYQGMCYPAACSKLDVQTSNLQFYKQFAVGLPGVPMASASPLISDYLAVLYGLDEKTADKFRETAVGCSDDYTGHWRAESYVMVTVLSIILVCIIIGTIADIYQAETSLEKPVGEDTKKRPAGLGLEIIKCFSLVQNIKFIFQKPSGSSQRLACLEGMRSMSMTWVILGHHFLFGYNYLHAQNVLYIFDVIGNHGGGILMEAVIQGEFSVDTFMFIGATLASFLLLKDLDKTKGWFHRQGLIRMVLFYVNRYLRLTIPYALVMGVFIGVMPVVITEPIGAAQWATLEATWCRRTVGWHLTYSNIFNMDSNICLGHTWYLSCEMICFFLSPLIIYPLWAGHSGLWKRVAAILWWCTVLGSLLGLSIWYNYDTSIYENYAASHSLAPFNFSPWGNRGQSYLMGLMMGYILYATKDSKIKIDARLNMIIWEVIAFIGLALIYGPYWLPGPGDGQYNYAYKVLFKLGWSIVLGWTTFACCKGLGGVINDFLSWGFWLPISKISFMTYLFHMSINWYFFLTQSYNIDYRKWLLTEWFIAQVWICLLVGLLGSLTLELPFGKIQKLLIQKLLGGRK